VGLSLHAWKQKKTQSLDIAIHQRNASSSRHSRQKKSLSRFSRTGKAFRSSVSRQPQSTSRSYYETLGKNSGRGNTESRKGYVDQASVFTLRRHFGLPPMSPPYFSTNFRPSTVQFRPGDCRLLLRVKKHTGDKRFDDD